MLNSPASRRIAPLIAEKRRAVKMNGRLMAALINSIPANRADAEHQQPHQA